MTAALAPDAHLLGAAQPLSVWDVPAPVLALVPHADDETLGCGGLLAGLYAAGQAVDVLLVTDGTQSHPHATSHDADARRDVREEELRKAITALGGEPARVLFWRKPDTQVPSVESPFGKTAVTELLGYLQQGQYRTVLTPYRHDPHGDHQATTALLDLAALQLGADVRVLQYLVWLGHQDPTARWPTLAEVDVYRYDVNEDARRRKAEALACHRSQLGEVFEGEGGFTIPDALAATVHRPYELYLVDRPLLPKAAV